ncbi:MAG: hypothetical protein HC892_22115 [Saprospiraceae bacterium]|nr:hypothetical protein [Saprospiraceae bacterium]
MNQQLWTRTNTVTQYDDRGNELENQDAIGVYSAAYFGYNDTRVTAVAGNAQRREISFEGFEDYQYLNDCTQTIDNVIARKNIVLYKNRMTQIVPTAHTGKASLFITGDVLFVNYLDTKCEDNSTGSRPVADIDDNCSTCAAQLNLKSGQKYRMSVWVATDASIKIGGSPASQLSIALTFPESNQSVVLEFEAEKPIVDGWQQMVCNFVVPDFEDNSINNAFELYFSNSAKAGKFYIDDFRVHPFISNMKSFVYDPYSLRLLAELDENNYATMYEYDDEGILVRVKRETEKGIITVQESRTVLKPNH